MATKFIYKCAECGSTDIEFRRWYNPNTGELGVDCEEETCWCKNCEEHREVEVVEVKSDVLAEVSILKNQTDGDGEVFDVLLMSSALINECNEKGGESLNNLKNYLRDKMISFINDADFNPSESEIAECVDRVAEGESGEMGNEYYWWETTEVVTELL